MANLHYRVVMQPVNLSRALDAIDAPWAPLTIATVNDYDVRVVQCRGEFLRHAHADTDEMFLVIDGRLTIRLEEGDVTLHAGDLYVVPRGRPHQTVSADGARILLLEPAATVNTGDTEF
jgi:mannose-6-phosphate isomerase-like protein (cupin superfamily)